MSKEMSVIVLGFLVFISPHLGIPGSWRSVWLMGLGLAIAVLGFLLRGEVLSGGKKSEHHPFIESRGAAPSAPHEQHDA